MKKYVFLLLIYLESEEASVVFLESTALGTNLTTQSSVKEVHF